MGFARGVYQAGLGALLLAACAPRVTAIDIAYALRATHFNHVGVEVTYRNQRIATRGIVASMGFVTGANRVESRSSETVHNFFGSPVVVGETVSEVVEGDRTAYVVLSTGNTEDGEIHCMIAKGRDRSLANVSTGDVVDVVGLFARASSDGGRPTIVLTRCAIAK